MEDDSKVAPANRNRNTKNATLPVFRSMADDLRTITKTMPGGSSGVKNYDAEVAGFSDDVVAKAVFRFSFQSQNQMA